MRSPKLILEMCVFGGGHFGGYSFKSGFEKGPFYETRSFPGRNISKIVSHCSKTVLLPNFGMSSMRFSKRKLHFLCWRNRNRKDNKKWKRPQKTYKNGVFFKGGHPKK